MSPVLCLVRKSSGECCCDAVMARLTIRKYKIGAKGRANGGRGLGLDAALGQDLAALGRDLLLPRAKGDEAPTHRAPVADDEGRLGGVLRAPRERRRA